MTRTLQQIAVLHDLFNQINERLSVIGETTDAYFLCQCVEILKQQGQTIDTQSAEITQLQAEVEALRKDAAWQPIKTAPKDGVPVLLRMGNIVGSGRYRSMHPTVKLAEDFYFDGASLPSGTTHWMPLPKPPTAIAKDIKLVALGEMVKLSEELGLYDPIAGEAI